MTDNFNYIAADHTPHHFYTAPHVIEALTRIQLPRLKILDLGCGNGSFIDLINKPDWHFDGIDESSSGIEVARKSFPHSRFFLSDLYHLPDEVMPHSYDVVISIGVIEHLYYPGKLLEVAKKSLKRNGLIILMCPYHGYFKNLALALSGKMDRHFSALDDGGHIKFFSVNTLTGLMTKNGFVDLQFRFAGRFPLLWKSMICWARCP